MVLPWAGLNLEWFFYLAPSQSPPQYSKTGGILRSKFRNGGMVVFICEAAKTL